MKTNLSKKIYIGIIILLGIVIILVICDGLFKESKTKEALSNIGNSASNYIKEIETSNSHINEFTYNYETGEVEYSPYPITLKMYNKIDDNMTESDVVSIIGKYDYLLNGENTYLCSWGDSDMSKGFWIQITFDINTKKIISKNQLGLK